MSDKPKRAGGEEIFDVFHLQGDRDVSAEHYLLKKQMRQASLRGPTKKNQITDAEGTVSDATGPHSLTLTGTKTAHSAEDPADTIARTDPPAAASPAIRVETIRIDMTERLAAMQTAQQKAKDQLRALESQYPPSDEPPAG